MTPEEKFNQDVWWILREIRNDEFLTPKGERVDFHFRVLTKTSVRSKTTEVSNIPLADTQRKLLYKLKEWKALDLLEPASDIFGNDIFNPPTRFYLIINQAKFGELYNLYEKSFNPKPQTVSPNTDEKPAIREKALELIATDMANLMTHREISSFFNELEVPPELTIEGSKKDRIFAVLMGLACNNKQKLYEFIEEAVHPFIHGGNEEQALTLQSKFNSYLKYDGFQIGTTQTKNGSLSPMLIPNEAIAHRESNIKEGTEEYREKISLLRKTYQTLMGVVEVFCRNFSRLSHEDTVELNKHYLTLDKAVWDIIDELQLGGVFETYRKYPKLFTNLFSAEKELNGEINWDVIRREMSARFGEIETIYQNQNASDILAEPDKQKQLNDVTLYLSELKEKAKETEKNKEVKEPPTTKIEITKMPPLQFNDTSENKLLNKTKITPLILIKDTRLDGQNYLLEVNNGKKIISFKSKKNGEKLEKETKQFKILYHLWDFRWELKDGRVLKKGDYASLDNLVKGSGSESKEAAYKHIQRLNNRFKNEGVAIEIKGENEKYRLIINKA
jgi:hypothetical protein